MTELRAFSPQITQILTDFGIRNAANAVVLKRRSESSDQPHAWVRSSLTGPDSTARRCALSKGQLAARRKTKGICISALLPPSDHVLAVMFEEHRAGRRTAKKFISSPVRGMLSRYLICRIHHSVADNLGKLICGNLCNLWRKCHHLRASADRLRVAARFPARLKHIWYNVIVALFACTLFPPIQITARRL